MASIIDPVLAKSLIKEYQQQNAAAGGPGLLTPTKQPINGYFIDRQSLETLLSNPNVAGISLHFAKHPDFAGKQDNVFTLAFAGAEPNTNTAAGTTSSYVCTGPIFDNILPCPPNCTDLG
jgi:hypothetical protein